MFPKTFFITGTDTNAGKTFVMCCLLQAAKKLGLSTAAVKPIAAGGLKTKEGYKNEDALQLQKYSTLPLSYEEINPLCLKHAIAPHIAAMQEQISVEASELAEHCSQVIKKQADLTLIEGAGGWMVPLNKKEFMGDIVKALNVPVILVVGMKLGCLNHALLTAKAIQEDGFILQGWIANQLDAEMPAFDENLDTLRAHIKAPLITTIPWAYDKKTSDLQINTIFE